MTNGISFNTNQMLNLENQVRITANAIFNVQDAYETAFEDVIQEQALKIEEDAQKQQRNQYFNLGMPAGFILDTSMLDEIENSSDFQNENLNYNQDNYNNYLLLEEN